MPALVLDVRLDGFADPIGLLVRDERGSVSFAYRADYLARNDAVRLSLSLPLAEEPFADPVTRSFFDNLLQERGSALSTLMAREGLARDDVAGLLFHLGKDCAGALSILPTGSPPVKVPGDLDTDYVVLDPERLDAIVSSLHFEQRLPPGSQDPSPLAGMQSKIALTLLPDGRLAEPREGLGAPTTHILKVPDRQHPQDARLEATSLELSQLCGLATCNARVLTFAGIDALLVTRFDRARDDHGRIVRLHHEDFAQALGLPAQLKYERNGIEGRRFDARAIGRLLASTDDPIGSRDAFVRATLFDLLVGNVDGHAKNFALLHKPTGGVGLAPRYDILPTRLDPNLTDELSFSIGTAKRLEDITPQDFTAFLANLGITSAAAARRVRDRHAGTIATALAGQLQELDQLGMKRFTDLIAHNIRMLLDAFALAPPAAALDRDAFVARGGGWLMS